MRIEALADFFARALRTPECGAAKRQQTNDRGTPAAAAAVAAGVGVFCFEDGHTRGGRLGQRHVTGTIHK